MNKYARFDEIQTNYYQRTQVSWFNVAEGGKRGAKNIINALCFCILLEHHPDTIHLVGILTEDTSSIWKYEDESYLYEEIELVAKKIIF